MKTTESFRIRAAKACVQRGFLLLSISAGFTALQDSAFGRDGRVVAAAAGARWGYNRAINENAFGYWYAPTPIPTSAAGSPKSISALPEGYLRALPNDAVPVVIFGKKYFFANGNDYSPVIFCGQTVYVIAYP